MDPRERLKRYLEQRKELGERELVLDGMTVEEVMKIVAAGAPAADPNAPRKPRRGDRAVAAESAPAATQAAVPPADAAPTPTPEGADETPASARSAPATSTDTPTTDWRAALRASGAAPDPKAAPRPPKDAAPPAPVDPPVAPKPPSTSKRYEFPRPVDTVADGGARASEDSPATPGSSATAAASGAAPQADSRAAEPVAGVDAPLGIVVGSASRDLFGTSIGKLGSLAEIAEVVKGCTRCPLYATATNPVPGEGSPTAELVCVGEAPGANEDATGRPFVGQSGELLTKILAAINLRREDVFICNVLKHRPPGNRNPLPEEVVACSPYLVQQLALIRPKVIVAFGTFAAQTLLNTRIPIGKLRGSVHRYHGVPLIVTYHPAALLRNPAWKRPTWEDVQLARRILDAAPRA